jgi:hypothetical protein
MCSVWQSRGTYLADLESHILPFEEHLQREKTTALLNSFFNPDIKKSDWRSTFLSNEERSCLRDIYPALQKKFLDHQKNLAKAKDLASLFCGDLLGSSSFDLKGVPVNSRKSVWMEFGKSGIVEKARRTHILAPILTQTAAAHFCHELKVVMARNSVPVTVNAEDIYEWEFPDELAPEDLEDVPRLPPMPFLSRLRLVEARRNSKSHQKSLQSFVESVQKMPFALFNGESGPLEKNVATMLRGLRDVRSHDISLISSATYSMHRL